MTELQCWILIVLVFGWGWEISDRLRRITDLLLDQRDERRMQSDRR
jgi:hypothetical protein